MKPGSKGLLTREKAEENHLILVASQKESLGDITGTHVASWLLLMQGDVNLAE